MKILIVSQQYYPETWRIVDTSEELARRGHDVTVLCGLPNDSNGHLIEEYRRPEHLQEDHRGVHILRAYDHPRKRGDANLYKKYVSFAKNATKIALELPGDFDLVIANQLSPIMQAKPAIAYAQKWGKKVLMYCQDLWPESLCARGIVNRGFTSFIYRHYLKVSRKIYNSVDHILVTSPGYIDYLSTRCLVPTSKMSYLPQYAETLFYEKAEPSLSDKRAHNFVFAGNVGKEQGLATLMKAAAILLPNPEIAIHIVGSGSDLPGMQKMALNLKLTNVIFHGRSSLNEIPGMYAACDALLIMFAQDSLTPYVLPAKLQSCMASGRPVLGSADGAVASIIAEAGCGWCIPSGDYRKLAEKMVEISKFEPAKLTELGKKGRDFSIKNYSKEKFFEGLFAAINELTKD